jgi:hypothetical protein
MTRCARHPAVEAKQRCETCTRPWCDPCVERPPQRGVVLRVCPVCDGRGRLQPFEKPERVGDFARLLPGVWKYPLRGHGWIALVAGALVFGLVSLAMKLGGRLMPGAALIVAASLGSYIWMFYLSIASTSADGADELPDWPDLAAAHERVMPLLRLGAAFVLCLAPAAVGWFAFRVPAMAFLALVAIGLTYLPICILALALGGRLFDLSPHKLLPAAVRAGPAYLVACGALLLVFGVRWVAQAVLGGFPWLDALAGGLLGSYFLVVQMRIIGLLYRTHEKRMRLV